MDALAVEASSFQLRFTESLRPRVSMLLNIAPDHLDWHGSFAAYVEAKARHLRRPVGDRRACGERIRPGGTGRFVEAPCEVRWFREGPPGPGEIGIDDGVVVARLESPVELWHPGEASRAFLSDAAAAAAAALAFGLPVDSVKKALAEARPGPHRGATVATSGSISFVDDSKATNPHAALASLEGRHDVVLIAGGAAKGLDLSPLRQASSRLAAVVAIGEAARVVAEVFGGAVPVLMAGSMDEAVEVAAEHAPPGGTVLLAPACASFDMFRDYAERGDRFAEAAHRVARDREVRVPSPAKGTSHA